MTRKKKYESVLMKKPNVLLICVDQWSGRVMGSAGHPCISTPTLDSLAANGVRFTNAYSAHPTCIPARRSLMTGTTAKTHGDRCYTSMLEMPNVPTLAGTFAQAGYQTYAVGKLHVYPQRDRIGYHDVILNEEGRHESTLTADDYELFLAEHGHVGQEFVHAMGNNDYATRPWHLPEHLHPTNWSVHQTCRMIKRRDPSRPAFWCMSFNHPHPPLVPLRDYLDMYSDVDIPEPAIGDWAQDRENWPYTVKQSAGTTQWKLSRDDIKRARRAYYALCTHIDHQIRLVIGLLREEGLLHDTIIMFTADHGDMLGNHGEYGKGVFYEDSARIPFIIVPTAAYDRMGHHKVDDRLVELRDVMPTLLDLAGVPIPKTVEGVSLISDESRDFLYGEHYEGDRATRMIRDERYKLIYYAVGNITQLFDLQEDPDETHNLAESPAHTETKERLTQKLIENLYGSDLEWLKNNNIVGLPDKQYEPTPTRHLRSQRGWRFM